MTDKVAVRQDVLFEMTWNSASCRWLLQRQHHFPFVDSPLELPMVSYSLSYFLLAWLMFFIWYSEINDKLASVETKIVFLGQLCQFGAEIWRFGDGLCLVWSILMTKRRFYTWHQRNWWSGKFDSIKEWQNLHTCLLSSVLTLRIKIFPILNLDRTF